MHNKQIQLLLFSISLLASPARFYDTSKLPWDLLEEKGWKQDKEAQQLHCLGTTEPSILCYILKRVKCYISSKTIWFCILCALESCVDNSKSLIDPTFKKLASSTRELM